MLRYLNDRPLKIKIGRSKFKKRVNKPLNEPIKNEKARRVRKLNNKSLLPGYIIKKAVLNIITRDRNKTENGLDENRGGNLRRLIKINGKL